jgi:hypothetical protein
MAAAGYAMWASAFLSAIVDNIPFVATMIPLIKSMAPAYGGPTRSSRVVVPLARRPLGGNGMISFRQPDGRRLPSATACRSASSPTRSTACRCDRLDRDLPHLSVVALLLNRAREP